MKEKVFGQIVPPPFLLMLGISETSKDTITTIMPCRVVLIRETNPKMYFSKRVNQPMN